MHNYMRTYAVESTWHLPASLARMGTREHELFSVFVPYRWARKHAHAIWKHISTSLLVSALIHTTLCIT
jgi:hypothetical protein